MMHRIEVRFGEKCIVLVPLVERDDYTSDIKSIMINLVSPLPTALFPKFDVFNAIVRKNINSYIVLLVDKKPDDLVQFVHFKESITGIKQNVLYSTEPHELND